MSAHDVNCIYQITIVMVNAYGENIFRILLNTITMVILSDFIVEIFLHDVLSISSEFNENYINWVFGA